ncbi:integrase [Ruoffia sp. FAM 24228]|uniref:integrase n=1 Tax=unclassified Ruoffia TaxID=2862149 RepID=UPI003888DF9F
MEQIAALLKEQTCELEIYDEQLVRRLVEKNIVHPEKLELEFKSEMIVEIEL